MMFVLFVTNALCFLMVTIRFLSVSVIWWRRYVIIWRIMFRLHWLTCGNIILCMIVNKHYLLQLYSCNRNKGPRVWRKKDERNMNGTQMAASSEMWSFHNQLWFGGRYHQLVLVTSASSSLLLMQQFTKISWNISWCQLPINSLEIMSSSSSRILLYHTAKSTQAWCENCHVHVLDWPANSPHFNPIENLWGIVKKKLHKHQPNTCEQLKDAIKQDLLEWGNSPWMSTTDTQHASSHWSCHQG